MNVNNVFKSVTQKKIILDDYSGLLIHIKAFTVWNKNKIAFKYKKQSSIFHKILEMSICNASSRHVHQQNGNTNGHQGP